MNGNKIFIDTNTAIYLLNGDTTLAEVLNGKRIFISFISQLELLGYKMISDDEVETIKLMLDSFAIIDINDKIKSLVITLRRKYSIKLPDCIIAATAIYYDSPLITSDKGFKKIEELDLILYE
ncbi:type II toxin-antitoxin system VapC family toxin [Marinilabilia salmonicolor]|uniref:type II toxin-antitoxin system VapC family toxin n=1 Tax=Marinilabilia salmonicolor TaxID=989 RepID=UPI000299E921|nr:type II toxin-antitoxin system VapC family toxin [Marinilabilia salmonicolor]